MSGLHVTGHHPTQLPRLAPIAFLAELNAPAWMADGLCAQTDPEAFFPEKGGSTREAKAICRACDVTAACLAYALANQDRFGIWGGLSERERRKLLAGGAAEPRVCALSDCTDLIPITAHGRVRYCTPEHASVNAKRAHEARRQNLPGTSDL